MIKVFVCEGDGIMFSDGKMVAYLQTRGDWVATYDCEETMSAFKLEMKRDPSYQKNETLERAGSGKPNNLFWRLR